MRSAEDIHRLFQSAGQVLMNLKLQDGIVVGADGRKAVDYDTCVAFAIECPPIDMPRVPTTRDEALPNILLRGPFKGAPTLYGVAFYIGIGFITVRDISAKRCTYEITGINGKGMEERLTFLIAARDLFFNDVKFEENPS